MVKETQLESELKYHIRKACEKQLKIWESRKTAMNPVHTEEYSLSIFTCCCDFNPTVIQNVMMEEKWLFWKVLGEICGLFWSSARMGWFRRRSFYVFLKDFAGPSLFSEGVSFLWSKANYQMVLHHMVHGETLRDSSWIRNERNKIEIYLKYHICNPRTK